MRKTFIAATALLGAALLAPSTPQEFVTTAATAGLYEVAAAELARAQASSEKVRDGLLVRPHLLLDVLAFEPRRAARSPPRQRNEARVGALHPRAPSTLQETAIGAARARLAIKCGATRRLYFLASTGFDSGDPRRRRKWSARPWSRSTRLMP